MTQTKQFDIYVSKGFIVRILPITEAGHKLYRELAYKCLEAGITIDEVSLLDRERLVASMRKAGYSVTSRLPKTDYDHMTNDQIMKELGLEA
jgi:hypothetical protein